MCFNICFVDNIQTVEVAQGEEERVGRIVRGAHAVDIQLLHKSNVALHVVKAHRIALVKVVVVVIYTLYFYGSAVKEEYAVFYCYRLKAREKAYGAFVGTVCHCYIDGVKLGKLRIPLFYFERTEIKLRRVLRFLRNALYLFAVFVCDDSLDGGFAFALHKRRHFERILAVFAFFAVNIAVEKIFTGVFIEEYISENAVIPEHILSFEERAVAPLKGDCNDFVCALFKKVGNIEFCGVMAAL